MTNVLTVSPTEDRDSGLHWISRYRTVGSCRVRYASQRSLSTRITYVKFSIMGHQFSDNDESGSSSLICTYTRQRQPKGHLRRRSLSRTWGVRAGIKVLDEITCSHEIVKFMPACQRRHYCYYTQQAVRLLGYLQHSKLKVVVNPVSIIHTPRILL